MFDLLCLTDRTLCREPLPGPGGGHRRRPPRRPDPPGKGPAGGPVPGPSRPGNVAVPAGRGALHPPHLRGGGSGPGGPGHPPPLPVLRTLSAGGEGCLPPPWGPPATRWKRPGRRWPWGPPTSPPAMCLLPPARPASPGRGWSFWPRCAPRSPARCMPSAGWGRRISPALAQAGGQRGARPVPPHDLPRSRGLSSPVEGGGRPCPLTPSCCSSMPSPTGSGPAGKP